MTRSEINKRGTKITIFMCILIFINGFFNLMSLSFLVSLLINIIGKPNINLNTVIYWGLIAKERLDHFLYTKIIPGFSIYYLSSILFVIIYSIVWKKFKENRIFYIFFSISIILPISFWFFHFAHYKIKYKTEKKKSKKDPNIKVEKPKYYDFLGLDF